jgi:ribosomal protein L40E
MERFVAAWEHESRRTTHTDATGMLLCRSCGASGSERAGRCTHCGAML